MCTLNVDRALSFSVSPSKGQGIDSRFLCLGLLAFCPLDLALLVIFFKQRSGTTNHWVDLGHHTGGWQQSYILVIFPCHTLLRAGWVGMFDVFWRRLVT